MRGRDASLARVVAGDDHGGALCEQVGPGKSTGTGFMSTGWSGVGPGGGKGAAVSMSFR
jgi:hypothetical protein